jgi:hypothetical protein
MRLSDIRQVALGDLDPILGIRDFSIDSGRITPYDAPKWSKVVGSGEEG